mmetsp:Transcript_3135/g.10271  ORF Transcript_3135/g.10271 Transcript_3135/m.10271 type:complete len:228 (-) Transcript_3135:1206-1889(-)
MSAPGMVETMRCSSGCGRACSLVRHTTMPTGAPRWRPSARTRATFRAACTASSSTVGPASAMVHGTRPICPATRSAASVSDACEYGPMLAGAQFDTDCTWMLRRAPGTNTRSSRPAPSTPCTAALAGQGAPRACDSTKRGAYAWFTSPYADMFGSHRETNATSAASAPAPAASRPMARAALRSLLSPTGMCVTTRTSPGSVVTMTLGSTSTADGVVPASAAAADVAV